MSTLPTGAPVLTADQLARIPCTHGGDLVEHLSYEYDSHGKPKFIKGFVLEPGPNGQRRQPCTWMPNGKHRLGLAGLTLCFPEL